MTLSERSDAILRRACFDCHCNKTRYPWDSRLTTASIRMGRHVRKGRAERIEETWESVRKGEMPTWDYLSLHPEARLKAIALASFLQDSRAWLGGSRLQEGGEERGEDGHSEREDEEKWTEAFRSLRERFQLHGAGLAPGRVAGFPNRPDDFMPAAGAWG